MVQKRVKHAITARAKPKHIRLGLRRQTFELSRICVFTHHLSSSDRCYHIMRDRMRLRHQIMMIHGTTLAGCRHYYQNFADLLLDHVPEQGGESNKWILDPFRSCCNLNSLCGNPPDRSRDLSAALCTSGVRSSLQQRIGKLIGKLISRLFRLRPGCLGGHSRSNDLAVRSRTLDACLLVAKASLPSNDYPQPFVPLRS